MTRWCSRFGASARPCAADGAVAGRRAFTLVELLVVLAVVALLVVTLLPVLGRARDQGRGLAVLSAGRQLAIGALAYQSDHDGHVVFGYAPASPNTVAGQPIAVREPVTGHRLTGQAVARYPARLLPYVGGLWEILRAHAATSLEPPRAGDSYAQTFMKVYQLGVSPTFGINSVYVGGDREYGGFLHQGGSDYLPAYSDPRIVFYDHHVRQPSRLVAFSTAASLTSLGVTGQPSPGFHRVTPPHLAQQSIWSADGQALRILAGPSTFAVPRGHFTESAAVAYLDGHLAREPADRLVDMRRWANTADHADHDPLP